MPARRVVAHPLLAWAVPGMTDKRWLGAKRWIQRTLPEEGYDAAVAHADGTCNGYGRMHGHDEEDDVRRGRRGVVPH
jgi:hypothetical protein